MSWGQKQVFQYKRKIVWYLHYLSNTLTTTRDGVNPQLSSLFSSTTASERFSFMRCSSRHDGCRCYCRCCCVVAETTRSKILPDAWSLKNLGVSSDQVPEMFHLENWGVPLLDSFHSLLGGRCWKLKSRDCPHGWFPVLEVACRVLRFVREHFSVKYCALLLVHVCRSCYDQPLPLDKLHNNSLKEFIRSKIRVGCCCCVLHIVACACWCDV